jgi:hypothetical protein
MALAIGVLVYSFVLIVFFYDFLSVVLFDSLILYTGSRNPVIWADVFIYTSFLVIFLPVLKTAQILSDRDKRIINFLALMTILLFIPYLVQGKAINYQRIPYLSLWFITGMAASFFLLRHYVRAHIALAFVILCSIVVVGHLRGTPKESLTHEEFTSLPLSQAMERYCPQERRCSFLLLTDTADNIHRLSVYHDAFHASRFTSMWYLPQLIIPEPYRRLSIEDIARYTEKYTAMVADDMVRFQPDVMIVLQDLMGYTGFDFIDFYAAHPIFRAELSNYERVETLSFDRRIYFPGVTTDLDKAPQGVYAVYVRKPLY